MLANRRLAGISIRLVVDHHVPSIRLEQQVDAAIDPPRSITGTDPHLNRHLAMPNSTWPARAGKPNERVAHGDQRLWLQCGSGDAGVKQSSGSFQAHGGVILVTVCR